METLFSWNDAFLTHLPEVDRQHQQLVQVINDLGAMVMAGDAIDREVYSGVRDRILEYAKVHFATEERFMAEQGLDERHVRLHVASHRDFAEDVLELSGVAGREVPIRQGRQLTTFLVQWLAFHILGMDQDMARQVRAVQAGATPEAAFEADAEAARSHAEPLVTALGSLVSTVSEQNRELRRLNRDLEERVAARTRQLEEANQRLEALATQDPLTGLPNRRLAMLSLERLWDEWRRYRSVFSLALLDADHFKPVNDRFGHAKGDELLRILAGRLRLAVRASDLVCRLGGDEFLVICPRCELQGALGVANRILAESTPLATTDGEIYWDGSLSLGVAQVRADLPSVEALLHEADAALYVSKQEGGGRATAHDAGVAPPAAR